MVWHISLAAMMEHIWFGRVVDHISLGVVVERWTARAFICAVVNQAGA